MFVNFSFLFTTISRFSEYKPWTYFSGGGGREGGRGLIFGVKIKLRNAWAYFRGNLYTGGLIFRVLRYFFSIWVFFHKHSRFTRQRRKGEVISLTPLCHCYLLHRNLNISQVNTAESSSLHIASSRTQIGFLNIFLKTVCNN